MTPQEILAQLTRSFPTNQVDHIVGCDLLRNINNLQKSDKAELDQNNANLLKQPTLNQTAIIELFANHFKMLLIEQIPHRMLDDTKCTKMRAILTLLFHITRGMDLRLALSLTNNQYPSWQDGTWSHRIKNICVAAQTKYCPPSISSPETYHQEVTLFLMAVQDLIAQIPVAKLNDNTYKTITAIDRAIDSVRTVIDVFDGESVNVAEIPDSIISNLNDLLSDTVYQALLALNIRLNEAANLLKRNHPSLTETQSSSSQEHAGASTTGANPSAPQQEEDDGICATAGRDQRPSTPVSSVSLWQNIGGGASSNALSPQQHAIKSILSIIQQTKPKQAAQLRQDFDIDESYQISAELGDFVDQIRRKFMSGSLNEQLLSPHIETLEKFAPRNFANLSL